ncbi:MAG: hypothetical protein B7Y81_11190 [Caulobacter sp. 32-67-35]|nr:MAG: hypothetical protein B7Y81_11190 [Caulobacter sp. 32-67-35]
MSDAPYPTLRAANLARQAEWDTDGQITLSYRGNELAGEVGEACNLIKKLERERMGIAGSRASVAELAEELADVIICADLIAMQLGILLASPASLETGAYDFPAKSGREARNAAFSASVRTLAVLRREAFGVARA